MQHFPDRPSHCRERDFRDGFIAGELDRVGVAGSDCGRHVLRAGVGEDRHYQWPPADGGSVSDQGRQLCRFGQGQAAGRSRHQVQADGVGAGTNCRQRPRRIGHATDLGEWQAGFRGHVVWHRTRRHESTGRRCRIGRSHQRLPDKGGVNPDRPPADERSGLANARLADHEAIIWDERPQANAVLRIHHEAAQVAVVEPDQARLGRERGAQLPFVVGFDERFETELPGETHEPRQLPRSQEGGEEQDHVGTGGSQDRKLALVDDEFLRQDRQCDRRPNQPQIGD